MLIDWFTVLAQIVNFLVLVALMKRFLYGPLVAAIDAREQSIAARLAEAARKEQEAAARIEQLAKEAAETEREKAAVLAAARADADRQRGEILAQARENVKALEAKWRDELEREKAAFLDEVRRRAAAEILAATRGALHDLACADVAVLRRERVPRKTAIARSRRAARVCGRGHDGGQPRRSARGAAPARRRAPSKTGLGAPVTLHLSALPPWHGASNCAATASASAGLPTPIWIRSKTSSASRSTRPRRPAIR